MARLAWVLDVSERTLREWNAERRIPFVKIGDRVIRYEPAKVWAWLRSNTREARGRAAQVGGSGRAEMAEAADWQRIERLIADQVRSQLGVKEAA